MFLFSIKNVKLHPESSFGKESLNIVHHKEYAGTITFHKTLTLNTKIFKTSLDLLH